MSKEENTTRARSALRGTWEPLGKWAMVRGHWTIAKFVVNAENVYVVFQGDKRIGQYASFAEGQKVADEIERKAA